VARHQRARAQVTEDVVDAFMAVRPMHSALARRQPPKQQQQQQQQQAVSKK
jgi:hypothetical protein